MCAVLVAMRLSTRRVEIAGVTCNPDSAWMQQVGRNLTDCCDGFLLDTRYLLLDRDQKFLPLRGTLKNMEPKVILQPPRSPNLNAHMERFMRTLKSECLSKLLFFGEDSLRRALFDFNSHYHKERNHQGLGNTIIEPNASVGESVGEVRCRERLGGMLRYYHREAA
jgi:hypothetical protein